jgi:uncharacterized protein YcbK (DUF882 family)
MKTKLRKALIITALITSVTLLAHFLWVFDFLLAPVGSMFYEEVSIADLPTIPFTALPESEKFKYSEYRSCGQFDYENYAVIEINGFARYQSIGHGVKLYQLLTPDRLIGRRIRIPNLAKTQYLILSPRVFEVYGELRDVLEANGFDAQEIKITSAFRNPEYNALVNGASCSQHQVGTALDVVVGDINGDGKANQQDRQVVVDVLEHQLIKNNGGMGSYKNFPQLVHFDVRGKRARW